MGEEMASVEIGSVSAGSGEKVRGHVTVLDGPVSSLTLPVAIINSGTPGPSLVLLAGIHGSDYPGIEAAARIIRRTSPGDIRGTLTVFPLVNVLGFEASEPFLMPVDRQNINRIFPGDPAGTPSFILAHVLFEHVRRVADCVIDMHGGDTTEHLVPFALYYESGNAEVDARSAAMARLYDTPHVWAMSPPYGHRGTSIGELSKIGIPAIAGEAGYLGTCHDADVETHLRGVGNIMKHFGMLEGDPERTVDRQAFFRRDFIITTRHGGIFEPAAGPGSCVYRNTVLGRIRTVEGDVVEEIRCPVDGVIRTLFPKRVVHAGSIVYRGWVDGGDDGGGSPAGGAAE
jgi:predicted deacylase